MFGLDIDVRRPWGSRALIVKRLSVATLVLGASLALADQTIYGDSLTSNWQNWSWASVDLASGTVKHGGAKSIAVTAGPWQALYLHHDPQAGSNYQALVFWIHGGTQGGQLLQVQATLGGASQATYALPPLQKGVWQKVVVPLAGVGAAGATNFDGFWIQERGNVNEPVFYVDDISLTSKPASVVSQGIYDDALNNAWTSTASATVNLASLSPVHGGQDAILVTERAAGSSIQFNHAAQDASLYQTVSFWANGGATGGQLLNVAATLSGVPQPAFQLPALPKNAWQRFVIPLSALGVAGRGDFDGIQVFGRAAKAQASYSLDDIVLSVDSPVNPLVTITVDPTTQKAISPLIYGVNSTDFANLGPGFAFARQGGNRLTAYNWENNASNAGSDWYFQNDGFMGSTNEAGWSVKTFVNAVTAVGGTSLVTVPTAGYVSADKLGDGDVRKTTNYLATRFKKSVASKPGGKYVYPPVTTDDTVYQDEFVNYIKQFAKPNCPIMFDLDNEPDLWQYTHNEVHPKAVTYAELLANNVTYATAIKSVLPAAKVFGFVSYGWNGYRTLQNAPDANGRDFMDFYLDGINQAGVAAKKRLIDVLDLHWYPEAQGDGQRVTTDADSPGLSDARIQAPRSLWDSKYVESSWITNANGGKPIQLIVDTFGRITQHYPGTKLSFSEYYYGGANAISGAIAQADVLGIFGRYGVYAAANWGLSANTPAILAGFQAFRNYDRKGSVFGDQMLKVSGGTAAQNSVYAAVDKANPNRMTLVVINKTAGATPFTINVSPFAPSSAVGYSVTDGHFTTPLSAAVTILSGQVAFTAPPKSVTTIELRATTP